LKRKFSIDFFCRFDHDGHVDRQRTRDRLQARQASTKVISCPLSSWAPRATMIFVRRLVGNGRLEWRTMPKIERIDRLHIVVTIEQYVRRPFPAPPSGLATMAG
jgi:hypothetical protein